MTRVELSVDEVLIREGEQGDRYFAIVDGELDVTVAGVPAGTMVRGDGFGEIALLRSVSRTATVTATSPASVLALDRAAILAAVGGHPATARAAAVAGQGRLDSDRRRGPSTSSGGASAGTP